MSGRSTGILTGEVICSCFGTSWVEECTAETVLPSSTVTVDMVACKIEVNAWNRYEIRKHAAIYPSNLHSDDGIEDGIMPLSAFHSSSFSFPLFIVQLSILHLSLAVVPFHQGQMMYRGRGRKQRIGP